LALLSWAVIPYNETKVIADLNIGLLYICGRFNKCICNINVRLIK
jgi:NADH:ubiquinone oxidoreductase subunit H